MLFDRSGPGADYERLIAVQDPGSGLQGVLVLHSTHLGPAFGGIRRARYPDEASLVADACALAEAMSFKCALAGLEAGGGKMVLFDHPGLDRRAAYRAIGRFIEQLGGGYVCGPDIGTGDEELGWVRAETGFVNPLGNDAAGMTARGVLAGLRGVGRHLDGNPSFEGRSFLVQGLGAVGSRVASALVAGGATVYATDRDAKRIQWAKDAGIRPVAVEDWASTQADVLVPCASGGLLDEEVAARVPVGAICGSANNPTTGRDAQSVLAKRGVVYVPDLVVNAGAVIEGVLTMTQGASDAVRQAAKRQVDKIEATTLELLAQADAGPLPGDLAREMAQARLGKEPA